MERVDVDEIESGDMGDNVRKGLADPLGLEEFAMNYYELDPGDAFSGGLHTHEDQAEAFYVLEGTATFETMPGPNAESEQITVGAGQAVRFDPGEYQQGRNDGDEPVRALAFGEPRESEDVRVPMACRECGEADALRFVMGEDGAVLRCPACGNEFEADV